LFITCVNDAMFPDTGKATVAILERLGYEVVFPPAQSCCGQPHFNSGYQRETLPLVERFLKTFGDYETIVSPSASCVSMVHEYYGRMAEISGSTKLASDVASVAPRVLELSQFLVDVAGTDDVGAYFPHQVTYHPACHGLRMLKLGDRYQRLLSNVSGLTLVDLPKAEECCGFGGTFALKNGETSSAMVNAKADAIMATGAEVLTTTDNSCLLNIAGALKRRSEPPRFLHAAEILANTKADGEGWRQRRPSLAGVRS
jgi:L-lactate dehydrogenase complex protein LldE